MSPPPDVSVEEFFGGGAAEESLFSRLGRSLAELLQTSPADVQIFSAGGAGRRGGGEALAVWFWARGPAPYRKEKLLGLVAASRAQVRSFSLESTCFDTVSQTVGRDPLVGRMGNIRNYFISRTTV